jgi:hypothetical protein
MSTKKGAKTLKAKSYLEQIKILDAKINSDIEELAQLEALATKTTSVLGGERVQSSGSQQKMADCVAKIVEMKGQINREIDEYIDFKNDARKIVCACDADCLTLVHKRYFQFKTWERIAVEMNFTYQWVSGGLHQRALSQVQKALDERDGEQDGRQDNQCKTSEAD